MLGHVLSFATLFAIAATSVTAQSTKLTDRRYHYPDQIVRRHAATQHRQHH